MWNLTSPFGEFDISFIPSGRQGYKELARNARVIEVYGELIPVADLNDVTKSKEAAGRPKGIIHLPILIQTAQRRTHTRSSQKVGRRSDHLESLAGSNHD